MHGFTTHSKDDSTGNHGSEVVSITTNHENGLTNSQNTAEEDESKSHADAVEQNTTKQWENHVGHRVYRVKETVLSGINIQLLLELGLNWARGIVAEVAAEHVEAGHNQQTPSDIGLFVGDVAWIFV